ncbi:MAG TPA: hypothetical protein PLA50_16700 [Bacteroidia bacterium]|nr:hypothetical protein [Bacteroidia bacterium]
MNSHRHIDERSYEMHQVIVRILRADPACLGLVAQQMDARLADPDYSESLKDCVREWRGIVAGGLDRVLSVLEDRSDEGHRLRQNSPFAILMPQEERMRILRRYRQHEPVRTGAHPAGV